jgi:hypothetical protein
MDLVIVLALVAVASLIVTAPLRARRAAARAPSASGEEAADLVAARDAKYREIRDAELDLRTGKLSEADHQELQDRLRADAVEILHRLDRVKERESGPPRADPGAPEASAPGRGGADIMSAPCSIPPWPASRSSSRSSSSS